MSSGNVLGYRPLVPVAVALAVGIAWARHQGLHDGTSAFAAAVVWAALGLATARGSRRASGFWRLSAAAFLCLAVASFGSFLWGRAEKKAVPPPSLAAFLDGKERRYRVLLQPFPDVYPEKTVFPVTLLAVAENPDAPSSPTLSDQETATSPLGEPESFTTLFPGGPRVGVHVSVRKVVQSWNAGDVVEMPLTLRPLSNFENPGRYDYVADLARRGVFARASTKSDISWVRVPRDSAGAPQDVAFFGDIDALRGHLRRILQKNMPEPAAAMAQALFLGYRHAVPRPLQDRFQKAGVLHLLAISGLHVGLAAWAAFRLAQLFLRLFLPHALLRIPDVHLAWWAGCAAAAIYALLAGFAVPTQRALLMLAGAAMALVLYRRPDPLSLVSGAAVFILCADPNHLFRPSFQLSFAAVGGLGLFYPPWRERTQKALSRFPQKLQPLVRLFVDAFLISAVATLAVAPLTAYHFHGISLAGLAANTIIVPFLAVAVLPPGLAVLAASAILPAFASVALTPIGWALQALLWLIDAFAALPYAFAHVGPVSLAAVAAFYGILSLWAVPLSLRIQAGATSASVLAWILWALWGTWVFKPPQAPLFQVTALDVGQGSATLVRCPPNAAMLVDGGGFYDDSFDVGRYVVAPALWAMGIRRLDAVVLSHDHPDHRNGLRFILETFPVGRYVETGLTSQGLTGSALVDVAARRRIPTLMTLTDGIEGPDGTVDLGTLGTCRLHGLHPTKSHGGDAQGPKDLNEASLVVAVTYGRAGALLPGDIGHGTEQSLLRRWNFRTSQWLLVAAHHGSGTSTGEPLLDALAPQGVLISCGNANPFGFPAPSILQRLQEKGLSVLRTDLHGAVHATWTGSRWILTPTLTERPRLYKPRPGR